MRVADYIAERCVKAGASHVFLVTGGGAMHLNDAFGRNKNLTPICFHHEQSASMAAESYYRTSNRLAVLNVTTGPGGINALNGVYGAYVDSQAMIVISGQVKLETHYKKYYSALRQLGDQEIDIVSMAKPVVKYAKLVTSSKDIRKIMDKAIFLATSGRPGPVWVDVPVDISSEQINPNELEAWDGNFNELFKDVSVTENTIQELKQQPKINLEQDYNHILDKLKKAKRPVLLAGSGIRISGQHDNFIKLIDKLKIPVVTGWNAHDILPNDNEWYAGRPGTVGDRAGNFTVQNSDLLIVLGCRLNIRQISYNYKSFASRAYKIMVDIDSTELNKPTLNIDYKIISNLKNFIPDLINKLDDYVPPNYHYGYLNWCKERVKKYPVVEPSYKHKTDRLNPYCFLSDMIDQLNSDDCIVAGNGSAGVISFQVANIKSGQRMFSNSGDASMGYDLPAAIGACLALNKRRIICLAGDGSIMMNIQELQTISGYNLPIKIIVLNNNGYLSIKQTQHNYFNDNVFGTCPEDGVSLPDFLDVANAFKINSYRVTTMAEWNSESVQQIFNNDKPALIEIMLDPEQIFSPKLAAKKLDDGTMLAPSLENMSPFLSEEEMFNNTILD